MPFDALDNERDGKRNFYAFARASKTATCESAKLRLRRLQFPRAAMAIPACGDGQFRMRRLPFPLPAFARAAQGDRKPAPFCRQKCKVFLRTTFSHICPSPIPAEDFRMPVPFLLTRKTHFLPSKRSKKNPYRTYIVQLVAF